MEAYIQCQSMKYTLAILLYKQTVCAFKNVIILYIFPKLPLILTVALRLPYGMWCPILFPLYGGYLTARKDVFT